MIDLSKIEMRRGMAVIVVGVLVVAALAVSVCGGEEEKKENYEIRQIYGEVLILDTRNGNVSVINGDTYYAEFGNNEDELKVGDNGLLRYYYGVLYFCKE